jgi:hypothetical protein
LAFHSGREADHSLPSSAEVKECVELYLHSPIRLHRTTLPFTLAFNWRDLTVTKGLRTAGLRDREAHPRHREYEE